MKLYFKRITCNYANQPILFRSSTNYGNHNPSYIEIPIIESWLEFKGLLDKIL